MFKQAQTTSLSTIFSMYRDYLSWRLENYNPRLDRVSYVADLNNEANHFRFLAVVTCSEEVADGLYSVDISLAGARVGEDDQNVRTFTHVSTFNIARSATYGLVVDALAEFFAPLPREHIVTPMDSEEQDALSFFESKSEIIPSSSYTYISTLLPYRLMISFLSDILIGI